MAPTIYLDGQFLAPEQAPRISLFDRGYLLGDGVFETLRVYETLPFRLDQHIERLGRGLRILGIEPCPSRIELSQILHEVIRRSGLRSASVRLTVSRGEGPPGIDPSRCEHPIVSIVVRPLVPYPAEAYARGVAAGFVEPRRIPAASLDPSFKSAHYLPAVLAKRNLVARGLTEGIQRAVDGQVCSGTVSNLFLVQGDALVTPWIESGCLPGVTRAALLELAHAHSQRAEERRVTVEEVLGADEVFFTNSLMECLPVRAVDGRTYAAPGPTTQRLATWLGELIQRETGFAQS